MNDGSSRRSLFSTFTVNIIFVMLIIIGMSVIPLLSLQLNPTRYLPRLTIQWTWPEAPARVVEQEVTAVLEGVLSTVTGVSKVMSTTRDQGGEISLMFDKNVDLRTKRFEVASLLRESGKRLPEGVSYPLVRMNMPTNQSASVILSFQINGNASTSYIYTIAEELIKPRLALINGVYNVRISGATPREWEITYDQEKISALGINADAPANSIRNYLLEREIGGCEENTDPSQPKRIYLTLTGNDEYDFKWEDIPVASSSGRIIHLTDIASVKLNDQKPQSYFRINGLNTINLSVSADENVNNIKVGKKVKQEIEKIKKELPPGYSIRTSLDNTIYIQEEITKNIFRAVLSVVLLLLFVLAISRELKYLLIIAISLVANIFIAFIFYYLFKLEIHLYSLAGIAVSFGIIINNTIVMTDHIRYQKNRKVGVSLLAATLTTIGALAVIFYLDDTSKANLTDFAAVVIINLSVSLIVALAFIPSLLEKIKLPPKFNASIVRRKRRVVRFTGLYLKSINFIIRRRFVFILLAILVFGIPVFYLPDSLPKNRPSSMKDTELTRFMRLYNKTLGNANYVKKIKPHVNTFLGGTFRNFSEKAKSMRFYYSQSDEPQRSVLRVIISLAESGLGISDINDVCMGLENMLSGYDEIEMFTATITGADEARFQITFKPEHDFSIFPFLLKFKVEDYMNAVGSYNARVFGVGEAFSNQVYSDYINTTYTISLKGYNYDGLNNYADELRERLIASGKGRIKEVFLLGGTSSSYMEIGRDKKTYRNSFEMDKFYLTQSGSDLTDAYGDLKIYSRNSYPFTSAYINNISAPILIKSQQSEDYDYWTLQNSPLKTHSGVFIKMKDFSSVRQEVSNNSINREDQQYLINVSYDFIGNPELGRLILDRNIEETKTYLPLGYTVSSNMYRGFFGSYGRNSKYYLIFLVILIIYFICSILLESFRQPFTVICLIPFSFIGVFITFRIFKIPVDEGVFAAMILLCGIVVNATLYILNDFNRLRRTRPGMDERRAYIKAFNGKIIPIILTKLSTIVGLIPFLLTGKDERFWFALAAGTIGGLVFSMIGLIVYQPIMLKRESRHAILPQVLLNE